MIENMIQNIRAKDLIITDFPHGSPETKIKEVINLWINKRINFFLVIDKNNQVLGVATLYDILKKIIPYFLKLDSTLSLISINELLDFNKFKQISNKPISEIMTKEVLTVNENDDMIRVINLMYFYNFDFIPVLDKNKRIIGLIDRIEIEKKIIEIINS